MKHVGLPIYSVCFDYLKYLTAFLFSLTEVAPGIVLGKDILAWMDFKSIINKDSLRLMGHRIFREEPMGLREHVPTLHLEDRLTYDSYENIFFVNFEEYTVKSTQQIDEIKEAVERILLPLGKKAYTIVNYDNFAIVPDLMDEYTEMVKDLVDKYYSDVTRYTTSTFLRMKLGNATQKPNPAPHIYESSIELRKAPGKE